MPKPTTIDQYIAALKDWRGDAVAEIRWIVLEAEPSLAASIKWAQPVFESNGPVCYIRAFPKHVNFGFWRGSQLKDPKGLLLGTGVKMRNVKITQPKDIDRRTYQQWVKEAVRLNNTLGDPSRS